MARRIAPDVVAGPELAMVDWLEAANARVPEHVGFAALNTTERTAPCAGLDLGPRLLGATAIATAVGMLHHQERGVPAAPQTIGLEARWIDGPTVRGASAPRGDSAINPLPSSSSTA